MYKKSLIIGINNYQHFSVLCNSINDAEDIHSFLATNGFDSSLLLNSTQAELIKAIADFKKSLCENTVSLIYFSGHGLQDEKYNFLVASDSEVRIVEDIKYNCIVADDLLINNTKTNLHFVILDACRNNPFYSGAKNATLGLWKMNAPAGTLIAFSTSPNSISIERAGERNGIYTQNLLKHLKTPNLPAELVFKNTRNDVMKDTSEKQVPWEEFSLFGDHFSFITVEVENIEKNVAELILENKNVLLPELTPFLNDHNFKSESIKTLMLLLTLMKISFSYEQEGTSSRTVDEDYFTSELIDHYYPLFQERLIQEDSATEPFGIDIFYSIDIDKNVNFGYNSLEIPEESFPQMVVNYIKLDGQEGILNFYLSIKDGEHFLKPVIVLKDNDQIKFNSYTIITGNKVSELTDAYFKMREPFEKEIPKIESTFTIKTVDIDDFDNLLKRKV